MGLMCSLGNSYEHSHSALIPQFYWNKIISSKLTGMITTCPKSIKCDETAFWLCITKHKDEKLKIHVDP
jgi:hypothetical protein